MNPPKFIPGDSVVLCKPLPEEMQHFGKPTTPGVVVHVTGDPATGWEYGIAWKYLGYESWYPEDLLKQTKRQPRGYLRRIFAQNAR